MCVYVRTIDKYLWYEYVYEYMVFRVYVHASMVVCVRIRLRGIIMSDMYNMCI